MKLAHMLWGHSHSNLHWTFLHGMGGTGALWRPIAAALENDAAVLALDQRGHGESQLAAAEVSGREPAGYTPLDYGRDVVETLEALAFFPTFLVGHSMGVRTACAAAHVHPEGVRGLVLVDLGFSGVAGGGLGENLARFLRVLPTEFDSRAAAREFMARECPDPSMAQYLMAVSRLSQTGRVSFPFDHGALIQTIEAARDTSVRRWVEEIAARRIPVLVLRGARSLVWSHEEYERERAHFAAMPSVEFREVEGAGHGLPFEKRAEFVDLLRAFAMRAGD